MSCFNLSFNCWDHWFNFQEFDNDAEALASPLSIHPTEDDELDIGVFNYFQVIFLSRIIMWKIFVFRL